MRWILIVTPFRNNVLHFFFFLEFNFQNHDKYILQCHRLIALFKLHANHILFYLFYIFINYKNKKRLWVKIQKLALNLILEGILIVICQNLFKSNFLFYFYGTFNSNIFQFEWSYILIYCQREGLKATQPHPTTQQLGQLFLFIFLVREYWVIN